MTDLNIKLIKITNLKEDDVEVKIDCENSVSSIENIFLYGFTNHSASPELLSRKWKNYIDRKTFFSTDIFSLGLIIFKIFTGFTFTKLVINVFKNAFKVQGTSTREMLADFYYKNNEFPSFLSNFK